MRRSTRRSRRHRNPQQHEGKDRPFFTPVQEQTVQTQEEQPQPFFQPKLQQDDAVGENETSVELPAGTLAQGSEVGQLSPQEEEEAQAQPEEGRETAVQTQPDSESASQGNTGNLNGALQENQGRGQTMPEETREEMEDAFGADFSGVKLHADDQAAVMNDELNARAFTHGKDIYFNEGQYDPGTPEGKHLLAHELTHVVQQDNGLQEDQLQKKDPEAETATAPEGDRVEETEEKEEDGFAKAGRILAGYLVPAPAAVEKMLDRVGWLHEDNLAYEIVKNTDDGTLAQVKPTLVRRLYDAMDEGWTTDEEYAMMERLKPYLKAESEEGGEEEPDRSQKLWYIVRSDSWLRMKAEGNHFQPMKTGKVKTRTFLLDPAKEYEKTEQEVAAGTVVTWYPGPDDAKYAKIFWAGGEGWVAAATLTQVQVKSDPFTRVELLSAEGAPEKDAGGKEYYQIKVGDKTGWTQKENVDSRVFDFTYATPVSDDHKERTLEYTRGVYGASWQRRRSRQAFTEGAPNAVLSVRAIKKLQKIGYVNNGQAYLRVFNATTNTWDKTEEKLDKGIPVIVLEERLYEEQAGEKVKKDWFAKVMDFEGNEQWTWAGSAARGTTRHGNYTLYAKRPMDLPKITNPKVQEALAKAYAQEVDAMLAGKSGFSDKQKELFKEARAFLGNSALQGKVSDKITYKESDLEQEGNKLDAELIRRLDVFYKFLLHKKLVFQSKLQANDGVRSAAEAHRWSTAYMIQVGNIRYSSIAALTEGKDEDGNLWYDRSEDNVYKDVPLSEEELKAEEQKALADKNYKKKTTKKELDIPKTMTKIKQRASAFWGTTEAAEGYGRGDSRRLPNYKGQSYHVKGYAVDITFPFKFNYFDPVIDALAAIFGLVRAVRDANSAESWHYELVGFTPPGKVKEAEHPETKSE